MRCRTPNWVYEPSSRIAGTLSKWFTWITALSILATPNILCASTIEVTPRAAYSGPYGLEVGFGSCPVADDLEVHEQTVVAPLSLEACKTVTVKEGVVVAGSGSLTIIAGQLIALQNGFSVRSGGSVNLGTSASLDPYSHVYVQDGSPSRESTYRVEYWVNMDDADLVTGDRAVQFVAYSGAKIELLRVVFRQGPKVSLEVRVSSGMYVSTAGITVPSGWNKIAVQWEEGSSASAWIKVNSGTPEVLSGLDTQFKYIETVRWGLVRGLFTESSGVILHDEFASWR